MIEQWLHSLICYDLQISQRDILNSIDREMSGDLKAGFKCIGKSFRLLIVST